VSFSELCPWATDMLYDRVLGSMLRFPGKVVLRLGISLLLPSQAGSEIDFRNSDAIRMRHFSPRFATLFCQLYSSIPLSGAKGSIYDYSAYVGES
jgi:hypothetical protein